MWLVITRFNTVPLESVSFCTNRRFDETAHFPMNFQGYRSINRDILWDIFGEYRLWIESEVGFIPDNKINGI